MRSQLDAKQTQMGAVALCETKGLGSVRQAALSSTNLCPQVNQFSAESLIRRSDGSCNIKGNET